MKKFFWIFKMILLILICLLFIFFLFLILFFYLYWSSDDGKYLALGSKLPEAKSPKQTKIDELMIINEDFSWPILNNSTVTYTNLGKKGNTGNQLFEIASILGIAYNNKCRVIFPKIENLDIFKIFDLRIPFDQNIKVDIVIPEYNNYEKITIPKDEKVYDITGYRQTWKYFKNIRDQLRKTFVVRQTLIDQFNSSFKEKYWIALHVRRTDAALNGPLAGFSIPSISYYQEAIKYIRDQLKIPIKVCVSTDDKQWVLQHLNQNPQIDNFLIPENQDKEMDFINLYLSEYTIIGVSTYSWWAAFLNPKKKIVVCPAPWWNPEKTISKIFSLQNSPITDKNWIHLHYDTGKVFENYPYQKQTWNTKSSFARSFRAFFST